MSTATHVVEFPGKNAAKAFEAGKAAGVIPARFTSFLFRQCPSGCDEKTIAAERLTAEAHKFNATRCGVLEDTGYGYHFFWEA